MGLNIVDINVFFNVYKRFFYIFVTFGYEKNKLCQPIGCVRPSFFCYIILNKSNFNVTWNNVRCVILPQRILTVIVLTLDVLGPMFERRLKTG